MFTPPYSRSVRSSQAIVLDVRYAADVENVDGTPRSDHLRFGRLTPDYPKGYSSSRTWAFVESLDAGDNVRHLIIRKALVDWQSKYFSRLSLRLGE